MRHICARAPHAQWYYWSHTPRLSACCLAMRPICRVGRQARRAAARVHIWDAHAGATVVTLPPRHRGATWAIAFAPDSRRLASVGADNDGSLAVWRSLSGEWHDGDLLALAAAGDRPVRFTCWMTARDTGGLELATGGDGHAYFWRVAGGTLDAAEPLWGAQIRRSAYSAARRSVTAWSRARVEAISMWKDRCCAKAVRAHERGLEAIHAAGPNGMAGFATGGADGFVKLWTARCVHVRTYDSPRRLRRRSDRRS